MGGLRLVGILISIGSGAVTILAYFGVVPLPERADIVAGIAQILPGRHSSVGSTPAPVPAAPISRFTIAYSDGVRAARRKDLPDAIQNYQMAISAPDASNADRAKALDAQGYAYFRMTDYDNADRTLREASAIDPLAVSPRVNLLKVTCARAAEPTTVRQQLQTLRDSVATNARDRYDVETDKELFRICQYAGIVPNL